MAGTATAARTDRNGAPGVPRRSLVAASADAGWEQLVLRAGFLVTGAFLFSTAVQTWSQGSVTVHRDVVWLVFAQYALAFLSLGTAVLASRRLQRMAVLIPAATVFALAASFYVRIHIADRVYTDSAALTHIAAEKLAGGENPYVSHDRAVIEEAADRFGLDRAYLTSTTDGQPLEDLMSYPAGSVLALVPAVALGLNDVRWTVALCEIAVLVLLWWRAPSALRPLVAVPLLIDPDMALHYTAGGVMDYVWVLPMLACAILLYRRQMGWAALFFGIACGTKQQPWLVAPFLAAWAWHEAPQPATARARSVATFGGITLLGFLALNLPFIAWDAHGWLLSVSLPFREQLVPFGSGASLLTQTGIADLQKDFYSAASLGLWCLLALAYAVYFRTLRHGLWLASAVVMWFGYRGLQNYYIYWTPMILVALMAWWEEAQPAAAATGSYQNASRPERAVLAYRPAPRPHRPAARLARHALVPAAGLLLVVALAAIAIRDRATALPVEMRVVETSDRVGLGATTHATIELRNTGDKPVHPRFSLSWLPYPYYWDVVEGPETLAAGETATYTIAAPDALAAPPDGEPFRIKVNDANSITYELSDAIAAGKGDRGIVNPELTMWTQHDATTGAIAPAGWNIYDRRAAGAGTVVEPLLAYGEGATRLRVVRTGDIDDGSWTHAGLSQAIPFPSGPLTVRVLSDAPYAAVLDGWPLAAFGIEVSDDRGDLVWVLFQPTGRGDLEYDLPSGHHIKVFDVPRGAWATRSFDLRAVYDERHWDMPAGVTVKLFAGARNGQPASVTGYIGRIDVPAANAGDGNMEETR